MSVNKHMTEEESGNSTVTVLGPVAAASRNSARKAPGTRVGTIEDWRAGDTKEAGEKSGRGKSLRDGR
jgi:hypothetical protein